jgi:YidC/Oxa1 family membrane protein insertase
MMNRDGPADGVPTRNMILAIVLSLLIFIPYNYFVLAPQQERERAAVEAAQVQTERVKALPPAARGVLPREEALTESARIRFDAPRVQGSIALQGGRIDDLSLKLYRETVDPQSDMVDFLAPPGVRGATYGVFGWTTRDGQPVPLDWSAPEGATLTAQTPVTLTYASDGVRYERTIAIDEHYMFTVTDRVINESGYDLALSPYAQVRREGMPDDLVNYMTLHEGFTGVVDVNGTPTLREVDYKPAQKGRGQDFEQMARGVETEGGWLGITDKYWLAAVVPQQDEKVVASYGAAANAAGVTQFQAGYMGSERVIPNGLTAESTHRFFAGAKRAEILGAYQTDLGIVNFDKAIDWGIFWFLTRPFFAIIEFFFNIVGNFGVAIMLSTVVVKAALFPIAYNSYKMMSKLQKLQPKMKEMQERHKNDQQKIQQEMMRLYQTEKVNPVTGCLPILLQIPVFYALYKVLLVTIEMRHAPFFGWINDLSAPDPSAWINVFGLVPWVENPHLGLLGPIIGVGILPILYGVTMWGVTALSPQQAADPLQRRIFQLMPILFTFMFAAFPVGMVVYWTWSNALTIIQQYTIMRHQGVDTGFDKWLAKMRNQAPKTAS